MAAIAGVSAAVVVVLVAIALGHMAVPLVVKMMEVCVGIHAVLVHPQVLQLHLRAHLPLRQQVAKAKRLWNAMVR